MLECLRWGPTSLQTVKMNECEFYTVCTQLGAGNIKLKHTVLRQKATVNSNNEQIKTAFLYAVFIDIRKK